MRWGIPPCHSSHDTMHDPPPRQERGFAGALLGVAALAVAYIALYAGGPAGARRAGRARR